MSPAHGTTVAVLTAVTLAWALPLLASVAKPAGITAVSGRVTILERPGERTTDLQDAVVWLEPSPAQRRSAPPSRTQIGMESKRFIPRVRVVPVGSTVEFPNLDPFRHNVFSNIGPTGFDLGLYGRGERRGARFDRPGVQPIFCNIHSRMVAYVIAVATPYFAQAAPDGRFEVTGVEPGRYTLRTWHERGGEMVREIDVPAPGLADIELTLDARGYRPVPHRNKFGKAYPQSGADRY